LDASERARRLRRFAPPEVSLNVGADERAVSVAKLAEVARLKRLGPFRLGRRVPITPDGLTAVGRFERSPKTLVCDRSERREARRAVRKVALTQKKTLPVRRNRGPN